MEYTIQKIAKLAGVAQMYVADERFKEFYDKKEPGTAKFLRDAILVYTGTKGE